MRARGAWWLALLVAVMPVVTPCAAGPVTYAIDSAASRVDIDVGRQGVLRELTHKLHLRVGTVSGTIKADRERLAASTVEVTIDTPGIQILNTDLDAEERAKIRWNMESDVTLHIEKYPRITFKSVHVRLSPRSRDECMLAIRGKLAFHGSTKEMEIPVDVKFTESGLEARGKMEILQSDFGIYPLRRLIGLLRVPDLVRIRFKFVARATTH